METDDVSPGSARHQLRMLQADAAAAGKRCAAPPWYLVVQALSCALFVLSFGFGPWQSMGFAAAAVILCILALLRPLVTGTRADPWAYRRSLKVGAVLALFLAAVVGVAMFVDGFASPFVLPAAAALTFGITLVLGVRMERAFARSIVDGA